MIEHAGAAHDVPVASTHRHTDQPAGKRPRTGLAAPTATAPASFEGQTSPYSFYPDPGDLPGGAEETSPSSDPFGQHLVATTAASNPTAAGRTTQVQRKSADEPAPGSAPAFGPLTELAAAAQEVNDAAGQATVALDRATFPDAALERLNGAVISLGDALHTHAGRRSGSDDRAIESALRAATYVAHALAARNGPRSAAELALTQRIDMVRRLAATAEDPRGAADVSPTELAAQVETSLRQLLSASDLAPTSRDQQLLEETIATTSGWHRRLTGSGASPSDARRLATAVLQQQALLFDATAELQEVLAQPPGPARTNVVSAYLRAMARSTQRERIARDALERARVERRRRPLVTAGDVLEADAMTSGQLAELDPEAGRKARAEHSALERQHRLLDRQLDTGTRVSDYDIRALEVQSREQSFLHRTQLIELQARQLARALDASDDGVSGLINKLDISIGAISSDLLVLAEELPIYRGKYHRRVEAAEAEHGASKEGQWHILDTRSTALDEVEAEMRAWLARGELQATLRAAVAKAKEAQARTFAVQLATTVGLTLAGNLAAAATRGAVEGAWLTRASRLGAGEAEMLAIGNSARTVATIAGVGADLAVNTAGQVAQGDDASILTLLTVNAVNASVLGKLQRRFTQIEEVHVTLATWQRAVLRDMLTIPIEMVAGGALDHGTRMLLEHQQVAVASEDDAARWFWQGAAMALGRHINTRSQRVAETVKGLERSTKQLAEAITARGLALADEAAAVQTSGDVGGASRLLEGYRGLVNEAGDALHDGTAARRADTSDAADPERMQPGEARPKPVVLAGDDLSIYEYAERIPPEPGTLHVVLHGGVDDFYVLRGRERVAVSHRDLARYIENSGQPYERVRLISCRTGVHPKGAAQQLANQLGVEVIAPSDLVHIMEDGSLVVGPTEKVPSGRWETYRPGPSELRYTPAKEPPPPTLRERVDARRQEKFAPLRDAELAEHAESGRVEAERRLAAVDKELVRGGTRPGIDHDTYFVTPTDGARIAELVKVARPDMPIKQYRKGLLIGGGADAWYFEYHVDAGRLGGEKAGAVTAAEGGFGLPPSIISTGELVGFRGQRTIKTPTDVEPREPKQWTDDEKAEVDYATEREPLLGAGHVAASMDSGGTMQGFTPDLPPDMGLPEARRRLKERHAFPGKFGDDTHAFDLARALAAGSGWNTRVVGVVELFTKAQYRTMVERIGRLREMEPGTHGQGYSWPLEAPADGEHFAASNDYAACNVRNCAAFLEKLGFKLPERSGQMSKFMPGLETWETADAPVDARPPRNEP